MKTNTGIFMLTLLSILCGQCFCNAHPTGLEDINGAISEENVLQEQDFDMATEDNTIAEEEDKSLQMFEFNKPADEDNAAEELNVIAEENVIADETNGLQYMMATDEQVNKKDWVKIPGGLKHVSTSINYVWGVNRNDDIFRCNRPCSGRWTHVPGKLKQIDVGEAEVWGVNSNNDIFKRSANGAGGWQRIGGKLVHVSASGNGHIWGVNHNDDIFICDKPCTGGWRHIPGKLIQIDGGHELVFGVNRGGDVFRRAVDGSGGWIRILGGRKMKYVTVGAREVFGVDRNSKQVRCQLPCATGRWQEMTSLVCEANGIHQIEATVDELVATTTKHLIFRRKL